MEFSRMNMQISIKNAETRALADEITSRTGESLTEAVTQALRERLKLLRRGELTDKWDRIIQENRKRLDPAFLKTDHDAMLYDENGLPK